MRIAILLLLFSVTSTLQSQEVPHPLTKVDACKKFSGAVVRIQAGMEGGSGFVVDPDGWILTASHVIVDWDTRKYRSPITVVLPDNSTQNAIPVLQIDDIMFLRDFAILKIAKSELPALPLGDEDTIPVASDIAIIGFPLSAQGRFQDSVTTKFCLFGTIAARQTIPVNKINIEAIYFQGVSVKGLSGSPLISLENGEVIGIANLKLAAINDQLKAAQATLGAMPDNLRLYIANADYPTTIRNIIHILDRHLANGLGAATGINDAKYALAKAKRRYKNAK